MGEPPKVLLRVLQLVDAVDPNNDKGTFCHEGAIGPPGEPLVNRLNGLPAGRVD